MCTQVFFYFTSLKLSQVSSWGKQNFQDQITTRIMYKKYRDKKEDGESANKN